MEFGVGSCTVACVSESHPIQTQISRDSESGIHLKTIPTGQGSKIRSGIRLEFFAFFQLAHWNQPLERFDDPPERIVCFGQMLTLGVFSAFGSLFTDFITRFWAVLGQIRDLSLSLQLHLLPQNSSIKPRVWFLLHLPHSTQTIRAYAIEGKNTPCTLELKNLWFWKLGFAIFGWSLVGLLLHSPSPLQFHKVGCSSSFLLKVQGSIHCS